MPIHVSIFVLNFHWEWWKYGNKLSIKLCHEFFHYLSRTKTLFATINCENFSPYDSSLMGETKNCVLRPKIVTKTSGRSHRMHIYTNTNAFLFSVSSVHEGERHLWNNIKMTLHSSARIYFWRSRVEFLFLPSLGKIYFYPYMKKIYWDDSQQNLFSCSCFWCHHETFWLLKIWMWLHKRNSIWIEIWVKFQETINIYFEMSQSFWYWVGFFFIFI